MDRNEILKALGLTVGGPADQWLSMLTERSQARAAAWDDAWRAIDWEVFDRVCASQPRLERSEILAMVGAIGEAWTEANPRPTRTLAALWAALGLRNGDLAWELRS